MMKCQIENHPLFIKLGCDPLEQIHGHEVLVSLEFEFPGTEDDQLNHTINYCDIFEFMESLRNESVALIETLLLKLGKGIMDSFPQIQSLRVKVTKPQVPAKYNKGTAVSFSQHWSRS